MSTKKLFDNGKSFKTLSSTNKNTIGNEVESHKVLDAAKVDKETFVPHTDFSDPANFARYGSAQEYYEQSIARTYGTYPYDGSKYEKLEWHNKSSYLDTYLFNNRYPRTTGYAIFSPSGWGTLVGSQVEGYGAPATSSHEYITAKGGPNKGTLEEGSLATTFTGSNVYYSDFNQKSNLSLNPSSGTTVEFWLKKDQFVTSLTKKEVIFDLWNNDDTNAAKGRLMIELNGTASASPFWVTLNSGSVGILNEAIGSGITTTSLADNSWNHYAFTFKQSSTNVITKLYVNGALNESRTIAAGGTLTEVTGALHATIGSLITTPISGTSPEAGWGKLSGSIDEFRYWKSARTDKEIARNWFLPVHGGTNTDIEGAVSGSRDADLGVYFKFNEGTLDDTTQDAVVLDYSGRVSNGAWTGYAAASRNTGSAMDDSTVYTGPAEYQDPIIYSTHSSVTALKTELEASASVYDQTNTNSFYNSIPSWITEEDQDQDRKTVLKLTQILGSYFDTLQLQIEALPTIKDVQYTSGSSATTRYKPYPFTKQLLEGYGLTTPDLFIDAEIIESVVSRGESKEFTKNIHNVKNQIYQNIYNNLIYIFKSKGTEKAFRNLIRCFGVDDELIKLNLYGDGVTFKLEDDFRNTVYKKRYIDLNNTDRFTGTVYQYVDPANSNSTLSYISGSADAATATITTTGNPGNDETFTITDVDGTAVTFVIKTAVTTVDGTKDGANVIIGVSAATGSPAAVGDRFRASIAASDLNVAVAETSAGVMVLTQGQGAAGNTSIDMSGVATTTATNFTGGGGGAATAFPITIEAEAIFPKKLKFRETGFFPTPFVTASLFGMHSAKDAVADLTWASNDYAEFKVYAIREDSTGVQIDPSDNVYFMLTSSYLGVELTSDTFKDVYDNTKWNFAARFKPTKYPTVDAADGTEAGTYTIEFFGVNTELGVIQNSFSLSDTTVTNARGSNFLNTSKRLYLGASHTNFSGSVLKQSDAKLSSLRYWFDYLPDSTIKAHARDAANWGTEDPYKSAYLNQTASAYYVPRIDTLALNWDFMTVTGSDTSGYFTVPDYSSGSAATTSRYGWIGDVVNSQHAGRGDGFANETNRDQVVQFEYINTYRQRLPEVLDSADTIQILTQDDLTFTRDSRPVNYFWTIEKSMYQTISEEMINMFSSVVDFNNLIGEPVNRYRQDYKDLAKLRQLFYERIGNTPDLDKYLSFYKWIDTSVSILLQQLVPASANMSDEIRNMIESHVLERNKYWTKFPSLEGKGTDPEAGLVGINRHLYNWRYGHAPLNSGSADNCLWWKERAIRDESNTALAANTLSSSNKGVNDDRNMILTASTQVLNRSFTTPHKFSVSQNKVIHGGINYAANKDRDFLQQALHPFGPRYALGGLKNIVVSFSEDLVAPVVCNDVLIPNQKTKYSFKANAGRDFGSPYFDAAKGDIFAPFNLIKSSVDSGYNADVVSDFSSEVEVVNLHSDTYGDDKEVPMQGPFTERWVGGHQSRHIDLNRSGSVGFDGLHGPGGAGRTAATATIACHADIATNETITLISSDGTSITYTAKTANDFANNEFKADVSADDTATNLKNAIEHASGHNGKITIAASNFTLTLTQAAAGTAGNTTITETFNANATVSSVFAGGANVGAGNDGQNNRPEAWRIFLNKCKVGTVVTDITGALGFVGADYPIPGDGTVVTTSSAGGDGDAYVGTAIWTGRMRPRATLFREELAKRPVNIKNIRTTTSSVSHGNFRKNYEVINTTGRTLNDPFFRDQSFSFPLYPQSLVTTHVPRAINTKSVKFDGGNDATEGIRDAGTAANWNTALASKKITISAWVYKTGDGGADGGGSGYGRILSIGNATQNEFQLYTNPSERIYVRAEVTGGDLDVRTNNNAISLNTWHHIVVTWDGNASPAEVPIIYVDGVVKALNSSYNTAQDDWNSTAFAETGVTIGNDNDDDRAWEGYIGDVAIWNRNLTAEEAKVLYNDGYQPDLKVVLTTELVSWWRMGDGTSNAGTPDSNTTIYDSRAAAGAYDGTMTGGPTIQSFVANPVYPLVRNSLYSSPTAALPDRTGSASNKSVIVSRFSAPGGFETLSRGYLDPAHEEYSSNNALPFRNLSVLGSGSGEAGSIGVEDHLGNRRGLRNLRSLRSGQFGIDPNISAGTTTGGGVSGSYPAITGKAAVYAYSPYPAWHKTNRNRRARYTQDEFAYQEAESINFNGTSDYVNIGTAVTWNDKIGGSLGDAKAFTLSAWIQANGGGDGYPQIFNFGSTDRSLWIEDPDGAFTTYKILFQIAASTTIGRVYSTAGGMTKDTWHHVVATYSGGTTGGMNLYIDGVLDNNSATSVVNPDPIATNDCYIGASNASTYNFLGYIDEASIWDRALTQAEVTELYNGGAPTAVDFAHSARDNIIAYWPMGGGADTYNGTIYDVVGTYNSTAVSLQSNAVSTTALPKEAIPTYKTNDRHDNAFITHQIPQSDMRYAWITASSTSGPLGYETASVAANGASNDITFVDSRSEVNTMLTSSITFDGVADAVFIGTHAYWEGKIGGAGTSAKAFTLSAWIKADGTETADAYPMIFHFGSSFDRSLYIYDSDGAFTTYQVNFRMEGSTDGHVKNAANSMTAGRWHHVVATYSGDTAGTMNLYIDGALDNDSTTGPISVPEAIGTNDCFIGAQNNSVYNYKGDISNAAIWDKALTAAEVTELFNNGEPFDYQTHTAADKLVSWWKLGDARDSLDGDDDTSAQATNVIYAMTGSNAWASAGAMALSQINRAAPSLPHNYDTYYGVSSSTNTLHYGVPVGPMQRYPKLHSNDAYGHPSWKQARGDQHPVVRDMRKNNRYSVTREYRHVRPDGRARESVRNYSYTEPAVAFKQPVEAYYEVLDEKGTEHIVRLRYSYENNLVQFANYDLNRRLGIEERTRVQIGDKLADLFGGDTSQGSIQKLIRISSTEDVFPRDDNVSLNKIRTRTAYDITWWADYRGDETVIPVGQKLRNISSTALYEAPKGIRFGGAVNDDGLYLGTDSFWNSEIGGLEDDAKPFSLACWLLIHEDRLGDSDGSGYNNGFSPTIWEFGGNAASDPYSNRLVFLNMADYGDNDQDFYAPGPNFISFYTDDSQVGAGGGHAHSKISLEGNRWYHVVCAFAGGSNNGGDLSHKIFIDGEDTTGFVDNTWYNGPSAITVGDCFLGCGVGGTDQSVKADTTFPGIIDEAMVFSKALSRDEAKQLYNSGTPISPEKFQSTSNALISWWRMGDDPRDTYNGKIYDAVRTTNQHAIPVNLTSTSIVELSGINRSFTTSSLNYNVELTEPTEYSSLQSLSEAITASTNIDYVTPHIANSFQYSVVSSSRWPLDARFGFSGSNESHAGSSSAVCGTDGWSRHAVLACSGAGELQNNYTIFAQTSSYGGPIPGCVYARLVPSGSLGAPGSGSIAVADGDAASGMTEGEAVTIVSSDGTTRVYRIIDDTSNIAGTLATGDVMTATTDTGAGTTADAGDIAVRMILTGDSQNDYLVALKAAIEHENGHNGRIVVGSVPTEADGAQSMTLTQAASGPAGSIDGSAISQLTVVSFNMAAHNVSVSAIGDTLWETAAQSGRYPTYATYAQYANSFRTSTKEYSLVPEFRISEHMNYYINEKGGSFLARTGNRGIFEITGASIGSSAENNFYKIYSHSDFLKSFSVIRDQNEDLIEPGAITLECHAIKKLLPYKGFYPVQRTLQLAGLYADSYMDSIARANPLLTSSVAAKPFATPIINTGYDPALVRGATLPLFSPGILFNTIKAGIACDYPVFAGTWAPGNTSTGDSNRSNTPFDGPGSRERNGIVTASNPANRDQVAPFLFKNKEVGTETNESYADFSAQNSAGGAIAHDDKQQFMKSVLGFAQGTGSTAGYTSTRFGHGGTPAAALNSLEWDSREQWAISFWVQLNDRTGTDRIIDMAYERAITLHSNVESDNNGTEKFSDGIRLQVECDGVGVFQVSAAPSGSGTHATDASNGLSTYGYGTGVTSGIDVYQRRGKWSHFVVNFDAGCVNAQPIKKVSDGWVSNASRVNDYEPLAADWLAAAKAGEFAEWWTDAVSGSYGASANASLFTNFEQIDGAQNCYMARRPNSGYALNAGLDEFIMFNRCLTQAEVEALYNGGAPPGLSGDSIGAGDWHMDDDDEVVSLQSAILHYYKMGDTVSGSHNGKPDGLADGSGAGDYAGYYMIRDSAPEVNAAWPNMSNYAGTAGYGRASTTVKVKPVDFRVIYDDAFEFKKHDPDVEPLVGSTPQAYRHNLSDNHTTWHVNGAYPVANTHFHPGQNRSLYNVQIREPATQNFDYRFPFETLIEPEKAFAAAGDINLNFFDPHPSSSYEIYSTKHGKLQTTAVNRGSKLDGTTMQGSQTYKLAMHNFLAECIDFFVKDDLTGFVSRPEEEFEPVKAGITYKMRVNVDKNNITQYDRPSAFGPPCLAFRGRTEAITELTTGGDLAPTSSVNYGHSETLTKPTYSPFTPPYFDVGSRAEVEVDTQGNVLKTKLNQPCYEEISFTPDESRKYTLKEIFASASVTSVRDIYSSSSASGSVLNRGYNQEAMPLSSSVSLFNVARMKAVEYEAETGRALKVSDIAKEFNLWSIETKFETPILDFKRVNVSPPTYGGSEIALAALAHDQRIAQDTTGSYTSTGMWHQYGAIPQTSDGIFLGIQDVQGYKSLADVVGFRGGSKRVGEVADEKVLREAVIAIPFIQKRGRRKFFRLKRRQIDVALGKKLPRTRAEDAGPSIRDMVEKMQRYVFPPRFDFLTNRRVRPYAMYIFEFEQTLEKQDIADIWQNVLPEIGTAHDTQTATISHELFEEEFFGNRDSRHGVGLQDRLQWKVFKVKQKGKWNYFSKTSDSRDDERFKFKFNMGAVDSGRRFTPQYSYNWPYDYFSLVELVKLETRVDFEPPEEREDFIPPPDPGKFTIRPKRRSLKRLAEKAPSPGDTKAERRRKRKRRKEE